MFTFNLREAKHLPYSGLGDAESRNSSDAQASVESPKFGDEFPSIYNSQSHSVVLASHRQFTVLPEDCDDINLFELNSQKFEKSDKSNNQKEKKIKKQVTHSQIEMRQNATLSMLESSQSHNS